MKLCPSIARIFMCDECSRRDDGTRTLFLVVLADSGWSRWAVIVFIGRSGGYRQRAIATHDDRSSALGFVDGGMPSP